MKPRKIIQDRTKCHRVALDRKAIGGRIGDARRARGWTQKQLAEAMGLSHACIVGWECGNRLPQSHCLGTLASVLRRSLDWLLLGRGRNARHWKV